MPAIVMCLMCVLVSDHYLKTNGLPCGLVKCVEVDLLPSHGPPPPTDELSLSRTLRTDHLQIVQVVIDPLQMVSGWPPATDTDLGANQRLSTSQTALIAAGG